MIEALHFDKLPIGKKIGIGYTITIVLFLVVTFLYQTVLNTTLENYDVLLHVNANQRFHTIKLNNHLLKAQVAEQAFLNNRHLQEAKKAKEQIALALDENSNLATIGQSETNNIDTQDIQKRIEKHQDLFDQVVKAWKIKGLDHNSGLQGSFRTTIHTFESNIKNLKQQEIYVTLLQIRRHEKDYLLRGDLSYVEQVKSTIVHINQQIASHSIPTEQKKSLGQLALQYQSDFLALVKQNQHIAVLAEDIKKTTYSIENGIATSVERTMKIMDQAGIQTQNTARYTAFLILFLATVAIFAGVFSSVNITHHISRRVFTLVTIAEQFIGSSTVEAEKPRNELTILARAMGNLFNKLQNMGKELTKIGNLLEHASKELDDYTLRLLDQATVVEKATEQVTGDSQDLKSAIFSVTSAVHTMQDLSHATKERSGNLIVISCAMQEYAEALKNVNQTNS